MLELIPEPLTDLLYQLPVAGLLLVVVWKFLQFIDKRDANWLDTVQKRDAYFISELERHESKADKVHSETILALRENATALNEVTKVMEKVNDKMQTDAFEREHSRRRTGAQ